MSKDELRYWALFLFLPYVVAAAFHFSTWAGWPSLVVFGLWWFGVMMEICEKYGTPKP